MKLGNFSISLAVKDLAVSRAFYEKLGFSMTNGDGKKWVVLMNGTTTVGLFQGMFSSFEKWNTKTPEKHVKDIQDLPRDTKKNAPAATRPGEK